MRDEYPQNNSTLSKGTKKGELNQSKNSNHYSFDNGSNGNGNNAVARGNFDDFLKKNIKKIIKI